MRHLTKEEQKSYTESISKVYKPTGYNMFTIDEKIEEEAREQAEKIEENQTLGVYDEDTDLEFDRGWNAGEVSGYEDGYIAGAKAMA